MKIISLITVVFGLTLLMSSCTNFSVTNPSVQILTNRAYELMQQGDLNAAIARLESINDLNPNLAENHYNLGVAYYKMDDYEKAIKSLKSAIKINENLKDAYYSLAVAHEAEAINKSRLIDEAEKIKENNDIKKIKNIKEEEKLQILIDIKENYIKAEKYFISYINFDITEMEKEKILLKQKEITEEIKITAEKINELSPEEKLK